MNVVTPLRTEAIRPTEREARLKRLAIQLAAQLPEDAAEALMALRYTETLLTGFLVTHTPIKGDTRPA